MPWISNCQLLQFFYLKRAVPLQTCISLNVYCLLSSFSHTQFSWKHVTCLGLALRHVFHIQSHSQSIGMCRKLLFFMCCKEWENCITINCMRSAKEEARRTFLITHIDTMSKKQWTVIFITRDMSFHYQFRL